MHATKNTSNRAVAQTAQCSGEKGEENINKLRGKRFGVKCERESVLQGKAGSAGSGKIQKKQHGRKNDVFDGSQNLWAWCNMALVDVVRHSAALRDSTWRGAT